MEDTRIEKLREYLFRVLDTLTHDTKYQINANMLAKDINSYSLDKVPVAQEMETWVIGTEIHRDVYSFRSRRAYSQDEINNLKNIGFFESFENAIKTNNDKGVLPDIENIESIRCLNAGTMLQANTNTAEFYIQIEITYRYEFEDEEVLSL